jgi:hypothetical protein
MRHYWRLAAAVGDYRFALENEAFLSGLTPSRGGHDRALLESAVASARADRQKTRLAVLNRQGELAGHATLPAIKDLPWPADAPLVSPYRTRFESLFAGQPQPLRLLQIDRALPELQTQIELHAAAIAAASVAVDAAASAYRRGQLDITVLLSAHGGLRREQQGFLGAVLEYNEQIAEYALQVAGREAAPDVLVTTLIRTPPRDQQSPASSAVPGQARALESRRR